MNTYIFEAEKLQQMILDFYTCTGIAITLYARDGQVIAESGIHNAYCAWVRRDSVRCALCDTSNRIHMQQAEVSRKPVCYICHAGNRELIIPIFYDSTVIAYVQIGQFHDGTQLQADPGLLIRLADQWQIPMDRLLQLYRCVPTISGEKLSALKHILDILIRAFWEDGLIRCNRSMLSVRIEQYITVHLAEPCTVENLCHRFLLSKNALYRLFREEFGTTVGDFLLQKRISMARALLLESDHTLGSIAERCGFSDYNYFIRVFKKATGTTPLQYRKAPQKDQNT